MAINPDYLVTLTDLQAQLAAAGLTKQGYTPADHNLAAWTDDPNRAGSGQLLGTAGTIIGARIYMPAASTVGGIWTHVVVSGATLTTGQCFAALWDSAGALLDTSVDQAANWAAAAGPKLASFATATTRPAGFYDIGVWFNGTTSPQLLRGASHSSMNLKLTGQAIRYWTADTGRTTTAPATLGTKTAQGASLWFALNPTV